MVAAAVLAVLLVAFTLLRMWDDARDASWEDPAAPDAGPAPVAPAGPAPPGLRVAAIVVSLALGFASYVGLPLVIDAVLGDDDGGHEDRWTFCGDGVAVGSVTAPGGTSTVYLTDQDCE